jgi:hypothetical protein
VVSEYNFEQLKKQWKVQLNSRFAIYFQDGSQPCAFHRWMQRMLFGFKWERME